MTKREKLIERIRVHIMNGDEGAAMRIYVENRCISHSAYNETARKARLARGNIYGEDDLPAS